MRNSLINEYHVDSNKVNVTGIPISPKFCKELDTAEIYSSMNLNPSLKTILLFGNSKTGSDRKKAFEVLTALTKHLDNYQIVAVSGKSKKMIKGFENIKNSLADSTNLTKSGGLTSSESLASGLPILVINPIPGQEEENATYLVDSGAAVWLKKTDSADEVIGNLLNSPEKLKEMGENSEKIACKYSTKNICEKIMKEFL